MKITFSPEWQNVAVSLSGGADSALLAYLVCQKAVEVDANVTIHIINHVRMWKTRPWQQDDADRVFQWLFQRFYHTNFKRHTGFIAPDVEYGNMGPIIKDEYGKMVSGDNAQQRAYAEFIGHKYNIDAYYNAVTRNPKGINLGGMVERDIDPTEDNMHLTEMTHMGRKVYHPFRFIDKSEIVKKYKELDLMDLFNITRSCEGEFDGLDYTTYNKKQLVPTCGNCFWCREREWAIEQSK